jgi:hypothetical protein
MDLVSDNLLESGAFLPYRTHRTAPEHDPDPHYPFNLCTQEGSSYKSPLIPART